MMPSWQSFRNHPDERGSLIVEVPEYTVGTACKHKRFNAGWCGIAMSETPDRRLNVGILGCGPIAQAGHFESVTKARNAKLHAICDVAEDLVERFAVTHGAEKSYLSYEDMLADPQLDAVIIATADAFHVPAAMAALAAGKLCCVKSRLA